MDADEIRTLLGEMVFERAQKYRRRILQSSCTTNEDGVRHVSALVQGNGADCFYTQVWLRENGSFVPPATAPTTRTATAPTANTSARCCWRMRPSTPPPRHRPPRNPSRAWCGARPTCKRPSLRSRPAGTAMPPAWRCCSARNGGARNRNLTTRHGGCSRPIRRERWPRWTA